MKYGNSPLEYLREVIAGKILVLTTTNGTKLLQIALDKGAQTIITGSFPNLSAVSDFLVEQGQNVILGCAAWKDRINIEDMLFAGAVIQNVRDHFSINCDSSQIAASLYESAGNDLFGFLKRKDASHYHRLANYGLEKDIRYCLNPDVANILPVYKDGMLVVN